MGAGMQLGEMHEDRKKANVTLVFRKGKNKDLGYYQQVRFTSIPGKVIEGLVLEAISINRMSRR